MGRTATLWGLLALAASLGLGGCSSVFDNSAEQVTEDLLELFDEVGDVLSDVNDAESARSAATRLEKLAQRRIELQEELDRLKRQGLTQEEDIRLKQEYGPRLNDAVQRLTSEMARVQRIPSAWVIIASHCRKFATPPRPPSSLKDPLLREWEKAMVSRHGRDHVVRIEIRGAPPHTTGFVKERLSSVCEPRLLNLKSSGNDLMVVCAPIDDPSIILAGIDFGRVLETDAARGLIRVEAAKAKLPCPLSDPVEDPNAPNFYQQNLADLKSYEKWRIASAAERLSKVEPRQFRQEIAEAAANRICYHDNLVRHRALETFVRYSDDPVPRLAELLNDNDSSIGLKATEFIVKYQDPRAHRAVAKLLLDDGSTAENSLQEFGPPAQPALIPYLQHEDPKVRRRAVQVTSTIGTSEIITVVLPLLSDDFRDVRHATLESLSKHPDVRAISPVCKLLLTSNDRRQAERCLQAMGPMVEDTIITGLEHSDPDVVESCCNVLASVGTAKSIPALKRLEEKNPHRWMAITSIEQRIAQEREQRSHMK